MLKPTGSLLEKIQILHKNIGVQLFKINSWILKNISWIILEFHKILNIPAIFTNLNFTRYQLDIPWFSEISDYSCHFQARIWILLDISWIFREFQIFLIIPAISRREFEFYAISAVDEANFQHENYGRSYMCNISAVQPKSNNFRHTFCRNFFHAADIADFQLENRETPYNSNIWAVQPKYENFTYIFCRNFFHAADIAHFHLENYGRPYNTNISAVQPKSHKFMHSFSRNFSILRI